MSSFAQTHSFYKVLGQSEARPKLFGTATIMSAAFIGSPLAAFLLVSANLRAKRDVRGEKIALAAGFLMVVISCVLAFHLAVPTSAIWLAGSVIAASACWATHRHTVKQHLDYDGLSHAPLYGIGIAVLVGMAVAAVFQFGPTVI